MEPREDACPGQGTAASRGRWLSSVTSQDLGRPRGPRRQGLREDSALGPLLLGLGESVFLKGIILMSIFKTFYCRRKETLVPFPSPSPPPALCTAPACRAFGWGLVLHLPLLPLCRGR